jgi:hypothetical protein
MAKMRGGRKGKKERDKIRKIGENPIANESRIGCKMIGCCSPVAFGLAFSQGRNGHL